MRSAGFDWHWQGAQKAAMYRTFDWNALNRHAPALAGDEAYRQFCLPELSPHKNADQKTLVRRARVHLDRAHWFQVTSPSGPLQAYSFHSDTDAAQSSANGPIRPKRILLVHGWTGEAAFMSAFIEPLRRHGHDLVLFDLPAHGRSYARRASIIDCARAVADVVEQAGPFDVVITHSIGGPAALLAGEGAAPLPRPAPFGSIVLIATPRRFATITRDFGRHLDLHPAAQRFFDRRLERVSRRSLSSLTVPKLLTSVNVPALLVHARNDQQFDFSDAEKIAARVPNTQLIGFDHFGHANILYAPPVVRAVREFCSAR